MATTSNFGWETPDDTDLVKDGAAAMRTLGNSIDTSFVDLKGGTTGQILSKASNTDLDYTWITNDVGDITAVTAGTGISGGGISGAVTITNSMATAIDAKGDLVAGTGADAFSRIAVGANGTVLAAESSTSTGLAYTANAPGGGLQLIATAALTGATTITFSGISNKSRFMLYTENASTNTGGSYVGARLNGQGGFYGYAGITIINATIVSTTFSSGADRMYTNRQGASAADTFNFIMHIDDAFNDGKVRWSTAGTSSGTNGEVYQQIGWATPAGQVTSISLVANNNFDAGTLYLYGA